MILVSFILNIILIAEIISIEFIKNKENTNTMVETIIPDHMTTDINLNIQIEDAEVIDTMTVENQPNTKKSYTDEDHEYLTKVMFCEAGSSWITDEQQMLYGAVVLNRVRSPEFPNTVKEVILQPGQYHPEKFENQNPDDRTRENARKLLEGYDTGMPKCVVFQDNRILGDVWKSIEIEHLGTTYFCYSPNIDLYYQ